MSVATDVAIGLEHSCQGSEACHSFTGPLLSQLVLGRYDECSVLDLRPGLDAWSEANTTAARRARRCERLGYAFGKFAREAYVDDLFAINTSLPERQGRPMTAGYRERPSAEPAPEFCPRHGVHSYGVFAPEPEARYPLVAYSFVYRAGDLALVSQILGHGDYLSDDVMFLLVRGIVEAEAGDGFLVYNRHDSGTEGLREFKERVGFEGRSVAWLA